MPLAFVPQLRAAVRRRLAPARLLIVGLLPGLVGAACGVDYAGLAGTRVDGGPATQDASLFATDGSGPPPAPTGSAGTGGSFLAPRRGGGAGAGSDGATTVGGWGGPAAEGEEPARSRQEARARAARPAVG